MRIANNIKQLVVSAQNKIILFFSPFFSCLSLRSLTKLPSKKTKYWNKIQIADSIIHLSETVEEKGVAHFSTVCWRKKKKKHVLQYYSKKHRIHYEHWLEITFKEERLNDRYFQIKLGNDFITNQRIMVRREDAQANRQNIYQKIVYSYVHEWTKTNKTKATHVACGYSLTSTCIKTVMVTVKKLSL